MERRKFTGAFKREAVRLNKVAGVSVAQLSRDLGIHMTVLRRSVKEASVDPAQAFPGHGHAKPDQLEVIQIRREVAKLKAERDILKKSRSVLYESSEMKFGFIAKHRGIWPLVWMYGALKVSRGGLYALPRSLHSQQEEVLEGKVRASFIASDRTYGARRVWHDVLAPGLGYGLHRVERVMRGQALRARQRRLPVDIGERPAGGIAANVLDHSFAAAAPNHNWISDFTYILTAEGWLYVASVIDLFSCKVVGWSMRGRDVLGPRHVRCAPGPRSSLRLAA